MFKKSNILNYMLDLYAHSEGKKASTISSTNIDTRQKKINIKYTSGKV